MKLIDYFMKLVEAAKTLDFVVDSKSIENGDVEVENEFYLSFFNTGFSFDFDIHGPTRRIYVLQYSNTSDNLSGAIQFTSTVLLGKIIGLLSYVGMYKTLVKYMFYLCNTYYDQLFAYSNAVDDICLCNDFKLLEAILDKESFDKAYSDFIEYNPYAKSGLCVKPRLYISENGIYNIINEYTGSIECIPILLRYKEKLYGGNQEEIGL